MLSTRTDPGMRDSRTGLPSWVFYGEAFVRPRIKDSGLRQELPCKLNDPLPCRPVSLTPALERSSPKIHNIVPEGKLLETPAVALADSFQELDLGFELFAGSGSINNDYQAAAIVARGRRSREI